MAISRGCNSKKGLSRGRGRVGFDYLIARMLLGRKLAGLILVLGDCMKYSKGVPEKMCLYNPPDNDGCEKVNKLFVAEV